MNSNSEGYAVARRYKRSVSMALLLAVVVPIARAKQTTVTDTPVISKKEAAKLEATANTPEDHRKLVLYYRAQAREFRERVRFHQEMARWYRRRPLPYDGKTSIPMQQHCKEWASRFAEQAQRAAALATFHEARAFGISSPAIEQLPRRRVPNYGFMTMNASTRTIQVTREQSSLFRESVAASNHLYDDTKTLTYVVSAKGQALSESVRLRPSAAALFGTQQRFAESLTEPQKTALKPQLREVLKLRRDMECELNRLDDRAISPTSKSYFKSANRIKQDLQKWHRNEQQIGLQLGIAASTK